MPHPLDREDMESVITRSPTQFAVGLRAAADVPLPDGPFTNVLVAGMGGSWMAGELVRDVGLVTVAVAIHRDYDLPPVPHDATVLVVASSYSGNTEETLSAYDAAQAAGHALVGIASGGELERRCRADGFPFVKIPADPPTMQPRSATGYTVGILTQLFTRLGMAADTAVQSVTALEPFLTPFMKTARERGERLAPNITGTTPVIYASRPYATVAKIVKIKINENAKTPAFYNVFPELNHNELMGWTAAHGPFHVVVFADPDDHPRVRTRMRITGDLLRDRGIPSTLLPIEGGTRVEKVFSTLLVGDWLSYHLALALGVDPSPVPMVEDLKKRLKEE